MGMSRAKVGRRGLGMTHDRSAIDRALKARRDAWADWKGEQMEREDQDRIARLFDACKLNGLDEAREALVKHFGLDLEESA